MLPEVLAEIAPILTIGLLADFEEHEQRVAPVLDMRRCEPPHNGVQVTPTLHPAMRRAPRSVIVGNDSLNDHSRQGMCRACMHPKFECSAVHPTDTLYGPLPLMDRVTALVDGTPQSLGISCILHMACKNIDRQRASRREACGRSKTVNALFFCVKQRARRRRSHTDTVCIRSEQAASVWRRQHTGPVRGPRSVGRGRRSRVQQYLISVL